MAQLNNSLSISVPRRDRSTRIGKSCEHSLLKMSRIQHKRILRSGISHFLSRFLTSQWRHQWMQRTRVTLCSEKAEPRIRTFPITCQLSPLRTHISARLHLARRSAVGLMLLPRRSLWPGKPLAWSPSSQPRAVSRPSRTALMPCRLPDLL